MVADLRVFSRNPTRPLRLAGVLIAIDSRSLGINLETSSELEKRAVEPCFPNTLLGLNANGIEDPTCGLNLEADF
jgi:hypothetical protein